MMLPLISNLKRIITVSLHFHWYINKAYHQIIYNVKRRESNQSILFLKAGRQLCILLTNYEFFIHIRKYETINLSEVIFYLSCKPQQSNNNTFRSLINYSLKAHSQLNKYS